MADKTTKPAEERAEGDDAVQRFIEDLKAAPADGHVMHGMVKPADGDDHGVMVAHPGSCDEWVLVPAAAIQSIQRTGRAGCGAHSHATAEIQLKTPQSDLEKALSGIAGLHQARLFQVAAGLSSEDKCNPRCVPPKSCQQDQWLNWVCR